MDEPQYVYDTRPEAETLRAFVDPATDPRPANEPV
jgi:hypothetical protein